MSKKRYSKFNSSFIKKTPHIALNNGDTIMERDWTTIGSKNKIEPGKKPVYGEGQFLFTDSSYVEYAYKKRFANDYEVVTSYGQDIDANNPYDDMFDMQTNNLSDYVYFGSATELLRSTVDKIIREFPIEIIANGDKVFDYIHPITNTVINYNTSDLYTIPNPFNVDFLSLSTDSANKGESKLRNIRLNAHNYLVNGEAIDSYTVTSIYDGVRDNYKSYRDFLCDYNLKVITTITINDKYKIYVFADDFDVVYATDVENLSLKPNEEIITNYFKGLNFIERKILNRHTNPIYTSKFEVDINGQTKVQYCTWPSYNGHNIVVDSPAFSAYIDRLGEIGEYYDSTASNVINGRLTHESIKTFDWSNKHTSIDDTDEDYSLGNKRIESIFNVIGRGFDDLKNSIDKITNDRFVNLNSINVDRDVLINKVTYNGWDLYPIVEDGITYKVDKEKWFYREANQTIDSTYVTNEFVKRLAVFSSKLVEHKGTIEGVKMMLGLFGIGEDEYQISEEYATYENIHGEDILSDFDYQLKTLSTDFYGYTIGNAIEQIPLKEQRTSSGERFISPFMSYDHYYFDNNRPYFQSKGGWSKFNDSFNDTNSYTETKSYLRLFNYIADLTLTNAYEFEVDDIIYIVHVEDFKDHYPDNKLTHFFTLVNPSNPHIISSWEAVDEDHRLFDKLKYLNSIIDIENGNNPHTGYGKYDMGEEYLEMFSYPMKWYTAYSNQLSDGSIEIANFKFLDRQRDYGKKVFILNDIYPFNKDRNYLKDDVVSIVENNAVKYYRCTSNTLEHGSFEDRVKHFEEVDSDSLPNHLLANKTKINTKRLHITNLVKTNKAYKDYFKKHVLKYVEQVIPSTTILILNDYD